MRQRCDVRASGATARGSATFGAAALLTVLAAHADTAAPGPVPADRVAVLITDWAEPEGFDPLYRKEVVKRSFGSAAASADEPCTGAFVGPYPFRQQLGLVPFAVGFRTKGVEGAFDSMGLYRLSADGTHYEALYDPANSIAVADLPPTPGLVTAAKDMKRPLQRSHWAIDPRDGTNYLDGVVMIGSLPRGPGPNPLARPNGIRDADELSWAAAITDMSILYEDLTPRLNRATVEITETVHRTLADLFGDRIDVRDGAYAPTTGLTRGQDEVALEFAKEGFRRMVVTRETTDNNNYANNFMSRGFAELALCRAGYDGQIAFQQARQVGRTPEYNLALLHVAKTNLDRIAPGSDVAVLYTSYGLPFPDRAGPGPFSAPHPWSREVFHENAYNNYVAFKRYLDAYFGDRYRLHFNPAGKSGDRRLDNYFSYGLAQPSDFTSPDPEQRFRTLRENIDLAKRDGRREILVVLSHWYYNGRDPLLAVRVMQQIPLNSRADFREGKFWVEWCERVDAPEAVPCVNGDSGLVRLQYTETFDRWAEAFGVGYAQVIRSAIERFGVYPETTELAIAARGAIDREAGGTVAVVRGPLAGARVVVAKDLHPGEPESFDGRTYRAFADPADNFVSAWDSFESYVGTQQVPIERLAEQGRVVSPAVLFGPYRTIVNRPATFTLPVRATSAEIEHLRAFVYNEVSEDWDPVFVPAGGGALRYDVATRTASFETQVFGVFAIAATPPGWTPRGGLRHRAPVP
jgi:hypothetical protein